MKVECDLKGIGDDVSIEEKCEKRRSWAREEMKEKGGEESK